MTQEEKQLLLKDLCGRLPYGVMILHQDENGREVTTKLAGYNGDWLNYYIDNLCYHLKLHEFKPYLRPMSSMTEKERKEVNSIIFKYSKHSEYFSFNAMGIIYNGNDNCCCINIGDSTIDRLIDWLNAHHFDYRYLIEKSLAIEVTESNNPYKE